MDLVEDRRFNHLNSSQLRIFQSLTCWLALQFCKKCFLNLFDLEYLCYLGEYAIGLDSALNSKSLQSCLMFLRKKPRAS